MFIRCATAVVAFSSCVAGSVVVDTWKQADELMENSQHKFAEISKHAAEAAVEEQKIADEARKSMHDSADRLKESVEEMEDAKSKLVMPEISANPVPVDSSFMELPDSFSQFPGVEADMKKVREAEKVYRDKMAKLRETDDDLMKMAKADFQEGRDVVKMVGHLRSKPAASSSFIETGTSPFQKVLDAEKSLKAVNDQLAKDFNFE